jgi:integrase
VRGVRAQDLRHTAALLYLSAGVHFMRVSQLLGHATYTVTLDTYCDWIEQDDTAPAPLPAPPIPAPTAVGAKVITLSGWLLG